MLPLGNWSVSGRIQPSQVSSPVVGIEKAALEGTVRYWLEPLKTAARSPLGRLAAPGAPLRYVPSWPLPVWSCSAAVPLIAQYATGSSPSTRAS